MYPVSHDASLVPLEFQTAARAKSNTFAAKANDRAKPYALCPANNLCLSDRQ